MKNEEKVKMICPCCGLLRVVEADSCESCQARNVDAPMFQPLNKLPRLGAAWLALSLVIIAVVAFLATWLLINDMKILRVAAVALLGNSTKLTTALLHGDPDLLRYKIFTFDAYRLAALMSIGLIPFSMLGIWAARRAGKLAKLFPADFGGRRIAAFSMTMAVILFVSFSTAGISSIPRAIQYSRARHVASERAHFYHLHGEALAKYYAEFGTYPQEISDLREFVTDTVSQTDYWGNTIKYAPAALIASKGNASSYSNYQLVSSGPDGVMDTWDDIRMIDGVIVSEVDYNDPLNSIFTSDK
jgi:hypothetical protein